MPFLRSEYLLRLVEEARAATEAVVTVTKTDDGWQPLCSIYRLAFKQRAEAAIKSGQYRIDRLFGEDTRYVDACRLGYDSRMFDNLNTPADLQRAVSFISEQVQP